MRGQEDQEEICNFEIVKTVKYLGIKLGGRGRNIFGEKKMWLKKAQGHATKLRAQIRKSYDKHFNTHSESTDLYYIVKLYRWSEYPIISFIKT